jgi:hypothetical protein
LCGKEKEKINPALCRVDISNAEKESLLDIISRQWNTKEIVKKREKSRKEKNYKK